MGWIVYAAHRDRKQPLAHGRENPLSHLAIIPTAAPQANLEQPDAFNEIVATFASELGKGKQN